MNDDSTPDHPLPHLLSNDLDNNRRRRPLRILKSAFLTVAALAVGGATLLLSGPRSHMTAVTASFVDASPPAAADNDQAAPAPAPSTVETQAAPPPEPEPPGEQRDAGTDSDALFRQFQAWAQQQDSKPDQQQDSRQETSAPLARAPARAARKHRAARKLRNARAEMDHARQVRAAPRPTEEAPVRNTPTGSERAPPMQRLGPAPFSR